MNASKPLSAVAAAGAHCLAPAPSSGSGRALVQQVHAVVPQVAVVVADPDRLVVAELPGQPAPSWGLAAPAAEV